MVMQRRQSIRKAVAKTTRAPFIQTTKFSTPCRGMGVATLAAVPALVALLHHAASGDRRVRSGADSRDARRTAEEREGSP